MDKKETLRWIEDFIHELDVYEQYTKALTERR